MDVGTSDISAMLFPLATELLGHAEGGGDIDINHNQQLAGKIGDMVKNSAEWEKWKKEHDSEIRSVKDGGKLRIDRLDFDGLSDLNVALHTVDIYAERNGDKITFSLKDDYNFDTLLEINSWDSWLVKLQKEASNELIKTGKYWMDKGWIKEYRIDVPIEALIYGKK